MTFGPFTFSGLTVVKDSFGYVSASADDPDKMRSVFEEELDCFGGHGNTGSTGKRVGGMGVDIGICVEPSRQTIWFHLTVCWSCIYI